MSRSNFSIGMARKTLAALSHQTSFAIGCYCDVEAHCHRSVLRELLRERGAEIAPD